MWIVFRKKRRKKHQLTIIQLFCIIYWKAIPIFLFFAFQIESRIVFYILFICMLLLLIWICRQISCFLLRFLRVFRYVRPHFTVNRSTLSVNESMFVHPFGFCWQFSLSSIFVFFLFFLYSSSSLFRNIYHSARLNRSNYGKRSNLIDFIDEFHRKVHPNRNSAFLQILIHVGRFYDLPRWNVQEEEEEQRKKDTVCYILSIATVANDARYEK